MGVQIELESLVCYLLLSLPLRPSLLGKAGGADPGGGGGGCGAE